MIFKAMGIFLGIFGVGNLIASISTEVESEKPKHLVSALLSLFALALLIWVHTSAPELFK